MLDLELIAPAGARASLDISRLDLPARLRPGGRAGRARHHRVLRRDHRAASAPICCKRRATCSAAPELRQAIVVPGARDEILEAAGVRCYRLHGPSVPTQKPYRFMLATRSSSRIVAHERPDLIEVGSTWFAPWLVHLATRRIDLPVVWFYHSNFPRVIAPWPERAGRIRRGAAEFAWRYVRRLGRMVRATLAPSEFVAASSSSAGVERVVRVRAGRGPRALSPAPAAAAAETRRRYGLPDGPLAHLRRAARRRRRKWTCCCRRGPRSAPHRRAPGAGRATDPRAAGSSGAPAASGSTGSRSSRTGTRSPICSPPRISPSRPCSIETFGLVGARGAGERHARSCPPTGAASPRRSDGRARGACSPRATPAPWPRRRSACSASDLGALGAARPALRRGGPWLGRRVGSSLRRSTAAMLRVSLLVSIHDVTPALAEGVARLWEHVRARAACAGAAGGPRLARRVAARGAPGLRRVAARAGGRRRRRSCCTANGTTRSARRAPRPMPPRARPDRPRRRVPDARRAGGARADHARPGELRAVGLEPVGFVPPAWLAREAGFRAVGAAGLAFSEDDRAIRLFPSGRRLPSPVVRWSARTAVRAWGSVAVARARWALQQRAAYPRIALHPQDLAHPATAAALGPTLDRWLARHRPISYRDASRRDARSRRMSSAPRWWRRDLLARAWRIQWLVQGLGQRMSLWDSFVLNAFGDAACALTPLRIGGEPARLAGMLRSRVPATGGLRRDQPRGPGRVAGHHPGRGLAGMALRAGMVGGGGAPAGAPQRRPPGPGWLAVAARERCWRGAPRGRWRRRRRASSAGRCGAPWCTGGGCRAGRSWRACR